MIGKSAELFYGEGLACGDFTLEFHLDDSVSSNGTGIYDGFNEELEGIKRLNIFRYYEELNMLLPLETFHDEEKGVVYTSVESLGTYCLMDMEIWLEDIGYNPYGDAGMLPMAMRHAAGRRDNGNGIPVSTLFCSGDSEPEENSALMPLSEAEYEMGISVFAADNAPAASADYEDSLQEEYGEVELFTDKMDIVFVIQGAGESPFAYQLQLNSCRLFAQFLFQNMPELQVYYLITQSTDRMIYSGSITNAVDNYNFVAANQDSYIFMRLRPLDAGMSHCFDYAVQNIRCRENGKKAIFWAWNSEYISNFKYKYYDMYCMPQDDDTILMIMSNYLYEDQGDRWGIVCAQLCDKIMDSGVILSPLDELDRDPALIASRLYYYFMDKCTENIRDGEFLLSSTGLRQVPKWYSYISSMKKLQKIDTDRDGLTDYEEIDIAHPLITVNVTNRKYNFPTLAQCIVAGRGCIQEYDSVQAGFGRFGSDIQDYLLNRIRVVPLHSSPLDVDTDGDGFADNIYDENGKIFDWILESEDYFNLVDPDPLRREVVFQWPVYEKDKKAAAMVAGFTEYRRKMTCYHNAIDISAPLGSSVRAAFDGEVIYQTPKSGWCYDCPGQCECGGRFGNHIQIRSQIDGKVYITQYSHMSAIWMEDAVKQGGHVMVWAGSEIGEVGESGYAYGYHLDYLCKLSEDDPRTRYPSPYLDPLLFDLIQYRNRTDKDELNYYEYYMNLPKDIRNTCGATDDENGNSVHCYNCDDYIEKIRERYNLR